VTCLNFRAEWHGRQLRVSEFTNKKRRFLGLRFQ
jgi:hypothetical protein